MLELKSGDYKLSDKGNLVPVLFSNSRWYSKLFFNAKIWFVGSNKLPQITSIFSSNCSEVGGLESAAEAAARCATPQCC